MGPPRPPHARRSGCAWVRAGPVLLRKLDPPAQGRSPLGVPPAMCRTLPEDHPQHTPLLCFALAPRDEAMFLILIYGIARVAAIDATVRRSGLTLGRVLAFSHSFGRLVPGPSSPVIPPGAVVNLTVDLTLARRPRRLKLSGGGLGLRPL